MDQQKCYLSIPKLANGTTVCGEISADRWISPSSSCFWATCRSHSFFLGKFSSAGHWLLSASWCSVFTLSYHFFAPLESVSSSVLGILYHPLFLSSLLPSSMLLLSQFSHNVKYLTSDHCVFKNEDVIFDPFQSAIEYCCLHQRQVFTLNHIYVHLQTLSEIFKTCTGHNKMA